MCAGGGGSRSTITMPDTRAYDAMASQQLGLMQQAQSSDVLAKQGQLDALVRDRIALQTQEQAVATARANNTTAQAARLAALVGAPPPEKPAAAPVIGSDRTGEKRPTGKAALRIDRAAKVSAGPGAGLNITTGY
ncbi:hypothetical protein LBMAG41_13530 [Cyanobium sp.]|nr:hypothetical protein LBMAG41_13530 [Cyanobium sp.]